MSGKNQNKKALLVGLQYQNTLEGPHNDIRLIFNILKQRDYQIYVITDLKKDVLLQEVESAILWLLKADYCYFHFSGHCSKESGLRLTSENIPIAYLIQNMNTSSKLIATLDCCDSTDFQLRWKYNGEEMVSNSCNYNINSDIIIVGSSSGISRNIKVNQSEYGILSFSLYFYLKNKSSSTIQNLYDCLNKTYVYFDIKQNINIYSGKIYNIYEKNIIYL